MLIQLWYGARYYWHVLLRKLRIAPFGRLAKNFRTIDEIIAEWERDPETRREMAEARAEVRRALARNTPTVTDTGHMYWSVRQIIESRK